MMHRHDFKGWLVLLSGLLFFSGCSLLNKPEPENAIEARALYDKLTAANQGITSFKGVGRVRLRNMGRLRSTRAAFAGDLDGEKLRIDLMGSPFGSKAVFAGDGKYIYYMTRNPDTYHKLRTFDGSLERFISLPIKINEIVRIFAGQIPVKTGVNIAALAKQDGALILSLRKKWNRVSCKVYVDDQSGRAEKIEQFDMDGRLLYRADILSMQQVEGFEVPGNIRFSDTLGNEIELKIDRFMANAAVSNTVFSPVKDTKK